MLLCVVARTYESLTVTAEVATSSRVVSAILFKGLSSTFERMAWYTKRYEISDTFRGHRFSLGQNRLLSPTSGPRRRLPKQPPVLRKWLILLG